MAAFRMQMQGCAGDDAERALGAHEQVAQHVAGVVLAQGCEIVEHPAVGEHDLKPRHQVAHRPVAHHAGAAGIGGNQAADLRAALTAEMQPELPPLLARRSVQVGEHHAGVDGCDVGGAVDGADAVHPAQRQNDAGAVRPIALGHGAEAQAGVAADREDRLAMGGAKPHHGCGLLG